MSFAYSTHPHFRPLGVGKLAPEHGENVIEFFVSPAEGTTVTEVAPGSIRPWQLMLQERVFFQDSADKWRIGRFEAELPGSMLALRLPNGGLVRIHADDAFVRSNLPIENPLGLLKLRSTETPFWHERRAALIRTLAEQRAAYRGLTGLASSNVELYKHQFAIVRRVLNDPVPRYLLADEVGLGKTIEAGIIIRQHLLDNPNHTRVVILVPSHLVGQWDSELTRLFHVDDESTRREDEESVEILAHEDAAVACNGRPVPTLLVIDEAHQIAATAYNGGGERNLFNQVRSLARRASGVLLLSATPVLHNEASYLAMLHLLDPQAYPLDDLQGFQDRLAHRDVVATAIRTLNDDELDFIIEPALHHLEPLAATNDRLKRAIEALRVILNEDSNPRRNELISAVKIELQEGFRLDRRLLRTRRAQDDIKDDLPRRRHEAWRVEDSARSRMFEWLDSWRFRAADHPGARTEFADLLTAAFEHPNRLRERVALRRDALERGSQPYFKDESDFLTTAPAAIAIDTDPRVNALRDLVSQSDQKHIVFVSNAEIADRVTDQLRQTLTVYRLDRARHPESTLYRFAEDDDAAALVCDHNGEEGLNLQRLHSARLVHFDLPLSPNRIEQRLGRLDRLGAEAQEIISVVPLLGPTVGQTNYELAWAECLIEAVKVFSQSTASLQHALDKGTAQMFSALVSDGVEAILDVSAAWNSNEGDLSLSRERQGVENQDIVDQIEAAGTGSNDLYDRLESYEYDADKEGLSRGAILARDLDGWASQALQLRTHRRPDDAIEFEFDPHRTLLPANRFAGLFRRSFHRTEGRRGVSTGWLQFNRRRALRTDLPVLRVGHPFIEDLQTLILRDDRGRAYACWRTLPGHAEDPQDARLFFRFDFLIEANIAGALREHTEWDTERGALVRRSEDALPPKFETIWVESDGQNVTNPTLLDDLSRPYDRHVDTNLRFPRWDAVDPLGIFGDWPTVCQSCFEAARRLLTALSGLIQEIDAAEARLIRRSHEIERQLQARIAALPDSTTDREALERERAIHALLRSAVRNPIVRLDAVGAMFLSSGSPFDR